MRKGEVRKNGKNNDKSTISKEHNGSTMKMNLNKPLKINPRNLLQNQQETVFNTNQIAELLGDSELKAMGLTTLEDGLKGTYTNLEKEIELIKAKYQARISKYNTAIGFLRAHPHLKNLKEYEDYSKFSKFLDQSKFSMYSSKSNADESIGGSSLLPLNQIKVNQYKNNNINAKNK